MALTRGEIARIRGAAARAQKSGRLGGEEAQFVMDVLRRLQQEGPGIRLPRKELARIYEVLKPELGPARLVRGKPWSFRLTSFRLPEGSNRTIWLLAFLILCLALAILVAPSLVSVVSGAGSG